MTTEAGNDDAETILQFPGEALGWLVLAAREVRKREGKFRDAEALADPYAELIRLVTLGESGDVRVGRSQARELSFSQPAIRVVLAMLEEEIASIDVEVPDDVRLDTAEHIAEDFARKLRTKQDRVVLWKSHLMNLRDRFLEVRQEA